eukprot:scaffold675557_cov79-Prasinocladus_malaysianus.AAC.1
MHSCMRQGGLRIGCFGVKTLAVSSQHHLLATFCTRALLGLAYMPPSSTKMGAKSMDNYYPFAKAPIQI